MYVESTLLKNMTKNIIYCDGCKLPNSSSFKYAVGKSMDASGNGYETDWEYVDLCGNCEIKFYQKQPNIKLIKIKC